MIFNIRKYKCLVRALRSNIYTFKEKSDCQWIWRPSSLKNIFTFLFRRPVQTGHNLRYGCYLISFYYSITLHWSNTSVNHCSLVWSQLCFQTRNQFFRRFWVFPLWRKLKKFKPTSSKQKGFIETENLVFSYNLDRAFILSTNYSFRLWPEFSKGSLEVFFF